MECSVTIDERLLEEARRVLGTQDPATTIEASLREVIRLHSAAAEPLLHLRTEAELQQYLRDVQRPRTSAEQARWDAAVAAADRCRLDVGPDFDVVEELRQMRARSEEGLPAEISYGE